MEFQPLGFSNVPAGSGPNAVITDEVCFAEEMISDAMSRGRFHTHGRDVVFRAGEIEPILGAAVEP